MVMNPMVQSNKKNITKHHLQTNQKVEDLQETPHHRRVVQTLGVPTPPSIAQESKDLGPCQQFWQMDQLDAELGGSSQGFIYPL